ncbi:MAG: 50S ribosomal protein L30e [Thermoplasmata archaeon]|nr:50S ribosomal protein L30e [Thermoplasmata archaeon]NIS14221.1 50S ribosomal protein L30e [Thermoplasmata archaeon]NIS22056.1 50S ribosomal protein L30e [Thermoplasmata archaeon]NIT79927.1 50S ribosomal protein L30e [Thermoplasmata archaeon]NIU51077.1 50S ribosomal protein L30e [Thermoplasmata archaeon]
MDMNKALRQVVQTGEVHFGVRQARKALRDSTAQLIVVPENIPQNTLDELRSISQVPMVRFAGTNFELGTVCGKPFSVSALTVIEAGDSDILDSIN